MDSLKTLFEKEQFELVVKLTENSKDGESNFFLVKSLIKLDKLIKAEEILSTYKEVIYDYNPFDTICIDLYLIEQLNKTERLLFIYEYYANKPYVSQQVEEQLRGIKLVINNMLKQKQDNNTSVNPIETIRNSSIGSEIIDALYRLSSEEVRLYTEDILNLIHRNHDSSFLPVYIYFLATIKYDKDIKICRYGADYVINPATSDYVLTESDLSGANDKIRKMCKDPSIADFAINILNMTIGGHFPNKIPIDDDSYLIACILKACEYFPANLLTYQEQFITDENESVISKHLLMIKSVLAALRQSKHELL